MEENQEVTGQPAGGQIAAESTTPVPELGAAILYPIKEMDRIRLDSAFTYHPPKGGQGEKYVILRDAAKKLAELVILYTPPSREQSLALTKIEEMVFWANAAIARHE